MKPTPKLFSESGPDVRAGCVITSTSQAHPVNYGLHSDLPMVDTDVLCRSRYPCKITG